MNDELITNLTTHYYAANVAEDTSAPAASLLTRFTLTLHYSLLTTHFSIRLVAKMLNEYIWE